MSSSVHLVVLIHGLWGSPTHLQEAKRELKDANVEVLVPRRFASNLTYDGIDVCASRVCWEIDERLSELEQEGRTVTKISFTGYSLGGLIARYLIGLLHSRDPSFFDSVEPGLFVTIATPHLGIPRYSWSYKIKLMRFLPLETSWQQLYGEDHYSDDDRRPLTEVMATPGSVFREALELFDIHIFANGLNDNTVPYPSAAIELEDPFKDRDVDVVLDEEGFLKSWDSRERGQWLPRLGTLPPVLRYRFPFNYIILALSPILLPVVVSMMIWRLSGEGRKSRRRIEALGDTAPEGTSLSVLRDSIRRVEHELGAELIEASEELPQTSVRLSQSQKRIARWLNEVPMQKHITWFENVNAHAVIVVRDPGQFPMHERGRPVLKRWAQLFQ